MAVRKAAFHGVKAPRPPAPPRRDVKKSRQYVRAAVSGGTAVGLVEEAEAAELVKAGRLAEGAELMERVLEGKVERGGSSWNYAEKLVTLCNEGACKGMREKSEGSAIKRYLNKAESVLLTSEAFTGFHPLRISLLSSTLNNRAFYIGTYEGDVPAAVRLLQKALETEASSPSPLTLLNLSSLFLHVNKPDDALRYLGQAAMISKYYMDQPDLTSPVPTVIATQRAFKEEHFVYYIRSQLYMARIYWCTARAALARDVLHTAQAAAAVFQQGAHPLHQLVLSEQHQLLTSPQTAPPNVPLNLQDFSSNFSPSHLLPYALKAPLPESLLAGRGPDEGLKLPKIVTKHPYSIPHDPHRFLRLRDIQQRSAILDRKFYMQQIPVLGRQKAEARNQTVPVMPRRPSHWVDDPVDNFARKLQTYNSGEKEREKRRSTVSSTPPIKPHPPDMPSRVQSRSEDLTPAPSTQEALTDDDWVLYEALKTQAAEILSRRPDSSASRTSKVQEDLRGVHSLNELSTLVTGYVDDLQQRNGGRVFERLQHAVELYITVNAIASKWLRDAREAIEARNILQLTGVLKIQKSWRLQVARKGAQSEVAKRRKEVRDRLVRSKAKIVQRVGRGHVMRAALHKAEQRRDRALREEQEQEDTVREIACLLIQGIWKGYRVRADISRQEQAVRVVQRAWRYWLLYQCLRSIVGTRRKWRTRHTAYKHAALVIGRSWASHMLIRQARATYQARHTGLQMSFAAREEEESREWRKELSKIEQAAAVVLQACCRYRLSVAAVAGRCSASAKKTRAAGTISRAWRCMQSRVKVTEERGRTQKVFSAVKRCEQAHEAATEVQRVVRGMLGRKAAERMRAGQLRKMQCALSIQRVWRGHVHRHSALRRREELEQRNTDYLTKAQRYHSAVLIQAVFRGWRGRKECALKQSVASNIFKHAAVLQRFLAFVIAKKKCKTLRDARNTERSMKRGVETNLWAAICIQCRWRQYLAKKERKLREGRQCHRLYQPACVVQQALKTYIAKKHTHSAKSAKEKEERERAAVEHLLYMLVLVQTTWRGYVCRKAYQAAKLSGTTRIRRGLAYKAYSQRLDYLARKKLLTQGGTPTEHRLVGGNTAFRRPTWVERLEEKQSKKPSAPTGLFLAAQVSDAAQPYLLELVREEAARVVQAWYREAKESLFVASCRRCHLHLVYIKSLWRRGIRKVIEAQRGAAVCVQRVWRGRLARFEVKARHNEVRRQWVLAYVVPLVMTGEVDVVPQGGELTMREEAVLYAGYAARIIQTAVRRMLAKRSVEVHKSGLGKMLLSYEQAEEKVWAATLMQKLYRGHASRVYQKRKARSIVVLQQFRKLVLAKRAANEKREARRQSLIAVQGEEAEEAAITLQRAWRTFKQNNSH